MENLKELRAYIVSADDFETSNGGFAIDMWNDLEQEGKELPEEAHEFMKLAEERGTVYSMKGLMTAMNINEEVGMNDWIFITKAY